MSDIKAFFNQIHPVEEQLLDLYLAEWQEYSAKKGTIMTFEGRTERYLYFVLEGIQKSYFLHDAKEHVVAFTYAPSMTGIPESFSQQAPSDCFLETITDSRFLRISYEQQQAMMEAHRPLETLYRKFTEVVLSGLLKRYYQLKSYTIEERFQAFFQRSPHLMNMVSQKDIASYLNIDPTNLSKLLSAARQ